MRKKLPIGFQTFAKIREDNYYCVFDKTGFALQLLEQGTHYFPPGPGVSAKACSFAGFEVEAAT